MTDFTVESKSQLAKLMAQENLTVQHVKSSTAKFDLKSRTLYCPIWKNMDGFMYDLLMGHEVGHALETPSEGWHDALCDKGKNYKHFLNVVEDARIEKKIKQRYPGLKQSFIKAYKELAFERDFFGIKDCDVNKLPFIDRINIHEKCGVSVNIKFSNEEQKLVDEVGACETWNDVVTVTDKIFKYSKAEQSTLKDIYSYDDFDQKWKLSFDEEGDFDYDLDEDGGDEDGDGDNSGNFLPSEKDNKDLDDEDGKSDVSDSESDEDGENGDENEDRYSDDMDEKDSKAIESNSLNSELPDPVCKTDEIFRDKEIFLVDENCRPFVYATLPDVNVENVITPYKRVHELLTNHYSYLDKESNNLLQKFKSDNDKYISLLVKEFEMRKAAKSFEKRRISNTGDIDISKLYKYQIDDNIFRKVMHTSKGKSHGLVFLLDRSGSMSKNMTASIHQIMILTMFCRKVHIPFVVYGFGNDNVAKMYDLKDYEGQIDATKKSIGPSFSTNDSCNLLMSNVYLREYLSSNMSVSELNVAYKNLCLLAESWNYNYRSIRATSIPPSETLSNTPLIEAMIAIQPITKKFKEEKRLDIVNLVILHDGDSDNINRTVDNAGLNYNDNIVIVDRKNKIEFRLRGKDGTDYTPNSEYLREAIFKWFTKTTDANILGFFITADSVHYTIKNVINRRYKKGDQKISVEEHRIAVSKMKKDKIIVSKNNGYKEYYLIAGGKELQTKTDSFEIDGKTSLSKLKRAFIDFNEKKQVNRILVRKFIECIAARD